MKIAIIHDWLTTYAGAESVLEQMLEMFPQADIFCLVDYMPDAQRKFLDSHKITTSFIQRLPFSKSKYRSYLPLMPVAIEQFDLSEYDVIISSSHAMAKGVITGPDQLHISYIYSPIRYAWDLQHQYLRESNLRKGLKSVIARLILHYVRMWDIRTSNGVDYFISISNYIKRRVFKVYRRESDVIFPPVDTEYFTLEQTKKDFYVTASRMVPYKMVSLIVEAFTLMPDRELIVIGDGPEYKKVLKIAQGYENIKVLGYQERSVLKGYLQAAKAFVFAAEEDFGIAPLEAQSCGTPVICYAKGGALDTVMDKKTGVYFNKQEAEEIVAAIKKFETMEFDAELIRKHAESFSNEAFVNNFKEYVYAKIRHHEMAG